METSILERRPVLPVIEVSSVRATKVSESFEAQTQHWPGAGNKLGATKFGTRYGTRRNAPDFRELTVMVILDFVSPTRDLSKNFLTLSLWYSVVGLK